MASAHDLLYIVKRGGGRRRCRETAALSGLVVLSIADSARAPAITICTLSRNCRAIQKANTCMGSCVPEKETRAAAAHLGGHVRREGDVLDGQEHVLVGAVIADAQDEVRDAAVRRRIAEHAVHHAALAHALDTAVYGMRHKHSTVLIGGKAGADRTGTIAVAESAVA